MKWMHHCLAGVLLGALTLLFPSTAPADDPVKQAKTERQREDFLAARKAYQADDQKTFQRLLDHLEGYPLQSYLRYDALSGRLNNAPQGEIEQFIQDHAESSISSRLRAAWLVNLAQQKRWGDFLRVYQPYPDMQGVALRCLYLRAHLATGAGQTPSADWLDETKTLWLVGRSQPVECDAVFKSWRAQGGLTNDMIWQRVRLAMDNREPELAGHLAKDLSAADRKWVEHWRRSYKDPDALLDHPGFKKDHPRARDILRYAIKRMARGNAGLAYAEWRRIKPRYAFSAEDIGATERDIAVAAAMQHDFSAVALFAAVPGTVLDDNAHEWRVRAALLQQDWRAVLSAIADMPAALRDKSSWRYWQARALAQTTPVQNKPSSVQPHPAPHREERERRVLPVAVAPGVLPPATFVHPGTAREEGRQERLSEAEQIFSELARERSYYGFLAADRLNQSYQMNNTPIVAGEEELTALSRHLGIAQAYELYQMGLISEARREWDHLPRTLDARRLHMAAVLAARWGWHDRAIFTLAKAKVTDDLELRFPLLYSEQVMANAQQQELDPAWVYGVIRQESAFMSDARSIAGAIGLMQIMPATGKDIARWLRVPLQGVKELFDVDKNIEFGAVYLRHVLNKNEQHHVLATASYNAGPQRARQWRPEEQELPSDIWVENIPFTETRNYVQQVMAYTTIFSSRMGREIVPLRVRMPDVAPRPE